MNVPDYELFLCRLIKLDVRRFVKKGVTIYNYFIPFCVTVKTITLGAMDDPMNCCPRPEATVHWVINSTVRDNMTVAQKDLK